jgi:hypothetical protein
LSESKKFDERRIESGKEGRLRRLGCSLTENRTITGSISTAEEFAMG